MSSRVTKMTGSFEQSIDELVKILKREISGKLVTESRRDIGGCRIALLIFEKYYFRNGSYANLTVLLTETGEKQTADVIGSGGGEGIFNLSWGANSEFAEEAEGILADNGFRFSVD